jgi:predicted Zn-dependent protease
MNHPSTTSVTGSIDIFHRRRRRLALLLAALVAVVGVLLWLRPLARSERAAGLQAAQDGHWKTAEPLLLGALKRDDCDLPVVRVLAQAYASSGQATQAEAMLNRWCQLRPNDVEPFKRRMDLLHKQARAAGATAQRQLQERALADGRRALELGAWDSSLAQEVVWLMMQVGDFAEAESLCRRCLQQQPADPWLNFLTASIAHARGDNRAAQVILEALLARYPQFTRGQLLRAELHLETGEPEQALPLLRQVLAQDAAYRHQSQYLLGLALARAGKTEEAAREMHEVQNQNLDRLLAAAHDPDAAGVKLQRAEALLAGGQEEEALRILGPMFEQNPGFGPGHALLLSYYERRAQPSKAALHRRWVLP